MSKPSCWWWVRHAPTPASGNTITGQADVACDLSDGLQVKKLAERLPKNAALIVSPLLRARQSADALKAAGFIPSSEQSEAELMEQNFGAWQGKTWTQVEQDDASASRTFWADPILARPPGGESFQDVCERTARVVERLATQHPLGDLVLVCHAGPIRAALALALELSPERRLSFEIAPLSLTRLDRLGRSWRITGVNIL